MLKNVVKLELQIANKLYTVLMDNDSPIEHIKEALFQFQKYIGQVEDNIKAQQSQVNPDPVNEPEVKPAE